jgi:hypothetical protein
MNAAQKEPFISATKEQHPLPAAAPLPRDLENRVLRQAVQQNRVTFPAQVTVFDKQSRPDLQHKIVLLYFLHGWTMDAIAKRYGLGRQRMGQILNAWRIRAAREGYLQAIEPEHTLFQRVRLEQTNQWAELVVELSSVAEKASGMAPARIVAKISPGPAIKAAQPAIRGTIELTGSNAEEELQAIVAVLNNQLRLRSKAVNGNIDSCGQLLARAKVLCAHLEEHHKAAHRKEEIRIAAALSVAKELVQRFQEHPEERVSIPSESVFGNGVKSRKVRRSLTVVTRRTFFLGVSQRVAVGL